MLDHSKGKGGLAQCEGPQDRKGRGAIFTQKQASAASGHLDVVEQGQETQGQSRTPGLMQLPPPPRMPSGNRGFCQRASPFLHCRPAPEGKLSQGIPPSPPVHLTGCTSSIDTSCLEQSSHLPLLEPLPLGTPVPDTCGPVCHWGLIPISSLPPGSPLSPVFSVSAPLSSGSCMAPKRREQPCLWARRLRPRTSRALQGQGVPWDLGCCPVQQVLLQGCGRKKQQVR